MFTRRIAKTQKSVAVLKLNLKRRWLILSLLVVFEAGVLSIDVTSQNNSEAATVRGKITEATEGTLLTSARVELIAANGVEYSTLSRDGVFATTVPPGRYRINVSARGFYPFERSPVRLVAGDDLSIEFVLVYQELTEVQHFDANGVSQGRVCTIAYKPKSLVIEIADSTSSKELFLRYGKSDSKGSSTRFGGIDISYGDCARVYKEYSRNIGPPDKVLPVEATFDKITVIADEVLYDASNRKIEFSGKVKYQEGSSSKTYSRIIFDMASQRFIPETQ